MNHLFINGSIWTLKNSQSSYVYGDFLNFKRSSSTRNVIFRVWSEFWRVCFCCWFWFWLWPAQGPWIACIFGHGLLALLPWHCCTLIIVYVRPDNATWTDWPGGRVKFKGSLKRPRQWLSGSAHAGRKLKKQKWSKEDPSLRGGGECKNPAPDAPEINFRYRPWLYVFSNDFQVGAAGSGDLVLGMESSAPGTP